jgi:hypothetical protein
MFKSTVTRTLALLLPLATLSACSGEPDALTFNNDIEVLLVGDTTIEGSPAIAVAFGDNDQSFCSITLKTSNIQRGFVYSSNHTFGGGLSASCNSNSTYFTTSSKHPTQIDLEVLDVQPESQKITFQTHIKAVNVSQNSETYFELPSTTISAESPLFANLIN